MFSRYASPKAVFLNETAYEPQMHLELLDALGLQQRAVGVSSHHRVCSGTTSGLMLYTKRIGI
jgi:hypothetical protein